MTSYRVGSLIGRNTVMWCSPISHVERVTDSERSLQGHGMLNRSTLQYWINITMLNSSRFLWPRRFNVMWRLLRLQRQNGRNHLWSWVYWHTERRTLGVALYQRHLNLRVYWHCLDDCFFKKLILFRSTSQQSRSNKAGLKCLSICPSPWVRTYICT